MFSGCQNIIHIDFKNIKTKYASNMKGMFYGCENLKTIKNIYFLAIYI